MSDKAEMTPEEQAEFDKTLAELHARGYVDIDAHKELRPGVRVRHRGHQWPGAHRHGTGAVLALTEKPDSAWSLSWGMADIEMVVLWDKPWPLDSRLSKLAQYHVNVALDTHGGADPALYERLYLIPRENDR